METPFIDGHMTDVKSIVSFTLFLAAAAGARERPRTARNMNWTRHST